jgi:tetratricopeptide (TPR) repeat protein
MKNKSSFTVSNSDHMTPQIDLLLKKAIDKHKNANLEEAQEIYRKILTLTPKNPTALHMLGLIKYQKGDNSNAVELIKRSLSLNPRNANAHSNLGLALQELNQDEKAIKSFKKSIELKPDFSEAFNNLGNCYFKVNEYQHAINSYTQAVNLNPDFFIAFKNLGNCFREIKDYENAINSYTRAINLNSNYIEAYVETGILLKNIKQFQEAKRFFEYALALDCSNSDSLFNYGLVLQELGSYQESLQYFDKAIINYQRKGEVFYSYALSFFNLKKYDETLSACINALNSNFETAQLYSIYGLTLQELNENNASIKYFDKAIELEKKDSSQHYLNRGNAKYFELKLNDAISDYLQSLKIDENNAEAHWNLALSLLLNGQLSEGFREYEWRWKNKNTESYKNKRTFSEPLWLGEETLENKNILVYSEQGLGDTIQFSRYIKFVKERGANVFLQLQESLLPLFKNNKYIDLLASENSLLPSFDFQCPLMSLPYVFKTDTENIPKPLELDINIEQLEEWKIKLKKKSRLRIGLVWRGNSLHPNDHNRSIDLQKLVQYLPTNFDYFALQYEILNSEKKILVDFNIKSFEKQIKDFSDAAALCKLVDLVVSVDTSVAHLSATLNKLTFLLLPYIPDWRWQKDRTDSPWYSSLKLFRQIQVKDWNTPLKNLANEIILLKAI